MEANPWEYGKQLGRAVLSDAGLLRAMAYARGKGAQRVSISLQIDPEAGALQDLLWERIIFANGVEDVPFAASTTFALSRRIPSETEAPPPREGAFRLLLVLSSPKELDSAPDGAPMGKIDLAAEITSLRAAWDSLVRRGLLQVTILGRVSDELRTELADAGYSVAQGPATIDAIADRLSSADSLHLISHGAFKDGVASLLLENPEGRATTVSEKDFLAKLGERSLRLVFLQACQSATRQPGIANVLSGLAPKIALRASAVVAMQDFVRIDDARRFAQEFYDTLLSTGCADLAANAGRRALYRPDSGNWAIPALYLAPKADPLWQPDAILGAVQDLAEQFRAKPDAAAPFPIEVIRQFPDVSSKMETSPPGPRMRVFEAVSSALFPETGPRSPIVVITGNYGRAKTAQLNGLYTHFAARASQDGVLPLFALVSEFQPTDDTPALALANAISKTYGKLGIDLPARALVKRLSQPFVLCVDGDTDSDGRRRTFVFECLKEISEGRTDVSAVVTLDEQAIAHIPALNTKDTTDEIPILLVQLLSPSTVTQYLNQFGQTHKALLTSIQRANLFDLAGVPWLLGHLLRQSGRGVLSRSGVIARVVNGNFATTNLPAGVRRVVQDLLGKIAWSMQAHQTIRLDGARLYEVMDQVRGRRELQLEQLKTFALDTRILSPSDEDGVRFSYPGFQSYCCAQHLLDCDDGMTSRLDDVTATLGRRSRVRLWEDTLVLLSGMTDSPNRLVRRVLAGSSMSFGEHAFLAARCIHEAKLGGRTIAEDVLAQVLDSLIWRSTPMKEPSAAVRVQATECLGLLQHPASIPHLVSIAVEPVRLTEDGKPAYELSGLRQAALQVLLTMQDEAEAYVTSLANGPEAEPSELALPPLIKSWRAGDCGAMRATFERNVDGLSAIIAFILAAMGGRENMDFLARQMLNPSATEDTLWAIADSLLLFNPADVTRQVLPKMRATPHVHAHAAYIVGKLRVAGPDSEETKFLNECLSSKSVTTQGVALRALAQLGVTTYRELSEWMATGQWDRLAYSNTITAPKKGNERLSLQFYALESLRLIGTDESLKTLRAARNLRRDGKPVSQRANELVQLSYEVSEDVYWRITGGLEGDLYDPEDRPTIGR